MINFEDSRNLVHENELIFFFLANYAQKEEGAEWGWVGYELFLIRENF